MRGERRRAPQGALPVAACILLLLEVLQAALMQPGQLLQEGGALGSQPLASADPILKRCLGREAATGILPLQMVLDALDAGG